MKKNKRSSTELGIKIFTGALTVEKISDLEYRISASETAGKYLADLAEVPGTIWLIETHDTTARLRKRGATREEAEDALMRAKVKFVTRI